MNKFWKKGITALALLAVLGTVQVLKATADDSGMPAPKMPAEFDKLKALVGTWKGTADMGADKPMDVTHTFELTSGGSAVIEKLMVGTPKEMVSVYCVEGGKLVMTHYCSMGNQPKMKLMKSSDNELDFMVKGTTGIGSKTCAHMHGLNIIWKDADHITEQWTMYNDGKAQKTVNFELTRAKATK
jgi:hypothetical protein